MKSHGNKAIFIVISLFASEWIEGSAQDRKPNHT